MLAVSEICPRCHQRIKRNWKAENVAIVYLGGGRARFTILDEFGRNVDTYLGSLTNSASRQAIRKWMRFWTIDPPSVPWRDIHKHGGPSKTLVMSRAGFITNTVRRKTKEGS